MRPPAANSILVSNACLSRLPRAAADAAGLCALFITFAKLTTLLNPRQILMPYPIFRDGIKGGELLILGTKKAARDLVQDSRKTEAVGFCPPSVSLNGF